ncbi:uncharacterized protein KY384_005732 [Bacidia gigantensis]|uniref:uncharacterized protein n=1 Tax=Bacidia gigantensis TaxID=2732470 RepID=UPI001D0493AC|nr:uncharacterized protein KY384_005732 [Bacidia gigantensis]KAG8529097.1 hypothetical protein KY384_005732 [Bacidia gigantensis]
MQDCKWPASNIDLGTGEWFLPHLLSDQHDIRVRITYDEAASKSIFQDFRAVEGRKTALSQPPLPIIQFLEQFYDVSLRWPEHFASLPEKMIGRAAQYQADLISQNPGDFRDETIPIALALRCLVLTHEMFLFDYTFLSHELLEKKGYQKSEESYIEDPSVECHRLLRGTDTNSLLTPKCSEKLSSMIGDLVQALSNIMSQNRVQDQPLVFCTLLVFKIFEENIWFNRKSRRLRLATRLMENTFFNLCRSYEVYSEGFNPLSPGWNQEEWKQLMDGDTLRIACFSEMHEDWRDFRLWIQFPEQHDNLERRIETFVTPA